MPKINTAHLLYNLDLFEKMMINAYSNIVRVPGGWVYVFDNGTDLSSTFVPFNTEFDVCRKNKQSTT